MAAALNYTIVHASDARASAEFYAEVFGFAPAKPFGPFLEIETANGVTLAVLGTGAQFEPQHYAFLGLTFTTTSGRPPGRQLDRASGPGTA